VTLVLNHAALTLHCNYILNSRMITACGFFCLQRGKQMADCEFINTCTVLDVHLAHMPLVTEVYKKMYCQENPGRCARIMVINAMEQNALPRELLPNQFDRAMSIIQGR